MARVTIAQLRQELDDLKEERDHLKSEAERIRAQHRVLEKQLNLAVQTLRSIASSSRFTSRRALVRTAQLALR